jgi:hypothetical protein
MGRHARAKQELHNEVSIRANRVAAADDVDIVGVTCSIHVPPTAFDADSIARKCGPELER